MGTRLKVSMGYYRLFKYLYCNIACMLLEIAGDW